MKFHSFKFEVRCEIAAFSFKGWLCMLNMHGVSEFFMLYLYFADYLPKQHCVRRNMSMELDVLKRQV